MARISALSRFSSLVFDWFPIWIDLSYWYAASNFSILLAKSFEVMREYRAEFMPYRMCCN